MDIDWKNGNIVEIKAADLKRQLRTMGVSQPTFAERAQISYDALNKFLAGRRQLKAAEAEKIKTALSKFSEPPPFGQSWLPDPEPAQNNIPIYGYSIGGDGAKIELTIDSIVGQTPSHPAQNFSDKCFAVEILSDEFSPRYRPGELIFAIWSKPPTKSQDFIVELKNGSCDIRRFISLSGSELLTEYVNSDKTKAYRLNDIARIHAIVGTGYR